MAPARPANAPASPKQPLHESLRALISHTSRLLCEANLGLGSTPEHIQANTELDIPGLMPADTLSEGMQLPATFGGFQAAATIARTVGDRVSCYLTNPATGGRVLLGQTRELLATPADEQAWLQSLYTRWSPRKPLAEADITCVPVMHPQREEQAPQPPAREIIKKPV